MIFRQLFDAASGTYSYILARRIGGEALIIDPVLEKLDQYLRVIRESNLRLVKAVDTHLHADHFTGLGALRDQTNCVTAMGAQSNVDVVGLRLRDGDTLRVDGVALDVIYTPGHTDDSYSFHMPGRVFTGDTLLIRSTGRTDFQNGDARAQYDSLFNRILRLPDETLVFPAHDYKGETCSSIGEEKRFNPRLQVGSADEYAALMNSLNLPHPKLMDVVIPANRHIGLRDCPDAMPTRSVQIAMLPDMARQRDKIVVDLREPEEIVRDGALPGCLPVPYAALAAALQPDGIVAQTGRVPVFVCGQGEVALMAARAAQRAGLRDAMYLQGGTARVPQG